MYNTDIPVTQAENTADSNSLPVDSALEIPFADAALVAPQSKLHHALDWARRGFRIFPVRPNSKAPLEEGWTESATRDPARIIQWWTQYPDANIGSLASEWVVADLDVKGRKWGIEAFQRLVGPKFTSLTVRTTTGGKHVYYKPHFVDDKFANAVEILGPTSGLDVKSWNGYTLAPGSTINGLPYEIEVDAEPEFVPDNLAELLKKPGERRRARLNLTTILR